VERSPGGGRADVGGQEKQKSRDEVNDRDAKQQRRKLSILGLGLGFGPFGSSSLSSPLHPAPGLSVSSMVQARAAVAGAEAAAESPTMPGEMPHTPAMRASVTRAGPKTPRLEARTPRLDIQKQITRACGAIAREPRSPTMKGASSDEVEGMLVCGASSADTSGASAQSSRSTRSDVSEGSLRLVALTRPNLSGASNASSSSDSGKSSGARSISSGGGSAGTRSNGKASRRSESLEWDLDDLVTADGRLDVDAVSAALGLVVSTSPELGDVLDGDSERGDGEMEEGEEGDDWSIEARSVASEREREGIDEEEEQRAADIESSLESLVRQPGSQLWPIIEEDDDEGSASVDGLPTSMSRPSVPIKNLDVPGAARPASYLVVDSGSSCIPSSIAHLRPRTQHRLFDVPSAGDVRGSTHSVDTAELRGSLNESVLDIDFEHLDITLNFEFSGLHSDASGFIACVGQGQGVEGEPEVSLFGLGEMALSASANREKGEGGCDVGIAF
jgi:hypothetical protein